MKITIGLKHGGGQLQFDLAGDTDALRAQLADADKAGSLLELADTKGDQALIPVEAVAYVLIPKQRESRVGFGRD